MKTQIFTLPKTKYSFFFLILATIAFVFFAPACGNVGITCDEDLNCGDHGRVDGGNCQCECDEGYTYYNGTCVSETPVQSFSANISGTDVPLVFEYKPNDVDIEFLGDTIIIDGYIDHSIPEKSSFIYLRIVNPTGNDVASGVTYDLAQGVNKEHNIATHKYPFKADNKIYAVDTGSITFSRLDQVTKILEAEFSFSASTGDPGEVRYISNGIVKSELK